MRRTDEQTKQQGVSRRTLLKGLGVGVGGIAAVGTGGVIMRSLTNGAFSTGTGEPFELWHTWDSLTGLDRVIAAGVLACNPHNTQPWRIAVTGDGSHTSTIDIRSDPARRMPLNDASLREHFAGQGCAIESMGIAAAASGMPTVVTAFPQGVRSDHVASVVLGPPGTVAPDDVEIAAAIPRRHTDRGAYSGEPVTQAELGILSRQAEEVHDASVVWITDQAQNEMVGTLLVEATQAVIDDGPASTEAFSWFRNDRIDVDRHRDGLTLDCQGLDEITLFAAKVLPAQSRRGGDEFWLKATRDVHIATAAAYGVVVVDDVLDRAAQVQGGRLLGRLHLAATAAGLAFQHMNQVTERIDRDHALGTDDHFSKRWAEATGVPATRGLLAFRIGHSTRRPGLSPRRALSEIVGQA